MANEFIPKDYLGSAIPTTISGAITNVATSVPITSATGWPDGSNGKFVVTIDKGLASEEKLLVTSRSGLTLTISDRGYDNTAAVSHLINATIDHTIDALSLKHINALAGAMTTQGDMACRGAGLTFSRIPKGTTGLPLVAGASEPTFAALDINGLASAVAERLVQAGQIFATISATPDTGYLFIDGTLIVGGDVTYPALYAKIPAAWKSGSHDIQLPDWRGRSFLNAGTGAGLTARTLNALLGEETHLLTAGESGVAVHNHAISDPTHTHTFTGIVPSTTGGSGSQSAGGSNVAVQGLNAAATGITVNNHAGASASSAHNNMQPSAVINYEIKAH